MNTQTTWKELRFTTIPSPSGGGGKFVYNDPDVTRANIIADGFFTHGALDYVREQTPRMWDNSANATGGVRGEITGSDGGGDYTFYVHADGDVRVRAGAAWRNVWS